MAGQVSEKKLLEYIGKAARVKSRDLVLGIGDDCAALQPPAGSELLLSSDLLIEEVHFRLPWTSPFLLGYKALAVNVSDIAAMGGSPAVYLVSLGLPRHLSNRRFVEALYRGMEMAAQEFRVALAGGDLSASPSGVIISIAIVGYARPGRKLLRSGARPGDAIYVAGWLGLAAIGLELLRSGCRLKPASRINREQWNSGKARLTRAEWRHRCLIAHLAPRPSLPLALELGSSRMVHAMMDVSDGLSIDLGRLCESSRTGAVVYESMLPVCPLPLVPAPVQAECALHGGEDYALLFTLPPSARDRLRSLSRKHPEIPITRIGEITSGNKIYLQSSTSQGILRPRGFDHFTRKNPSR